MSPLEDEIRDTLRSEATRLREVRPLRLAPAGAHDGAQPAGRTRRTGWLLTWRGPAVAVAVVLLAAATLVTLKSAEGRRRARRVLAASLALRAPRGTTSPLARCGAPGPFEAWGSSRAMSRPVARSAASFLARQTCRPGE